MSTSNGSTTHVPTQSYRKILLIHDIILGLSLFSSVTYAPFAIAALFSKNCMYNPIIASCNSFSNIIIIILIAAGVCTIISSYYVRMPLILAPAIGPALLMSQVVSNGQMDAKVVPYAFVIAGFAGLLCMIKIKNEHVIRVWILENLPEELKLGIRAGVGALLANTGVDLVFRFIENLPHLPGPEGDNRLNYMKYTAWGLMAAGFAVIFFCERRSAYSDETPETWRYLAYRSPYVLVPIAIMVVSYFLINIEAPKILEPTYGTLDKNAQQVLTNFSAVALVSFFILITDIPGTPYEICRGSTTNTDKFDKCYGENWQIHSKRGTFLDSAFTFLGGFIGIPGSIYYAENNLVRDFHWASGRAGVICGGLLLILGVIILFDGDLLNILVNYVYLAVAPVIFFIGFKVVSRSMISPHEVSGVSSGNEETKEKFENYHEAIDYYLPAAILVVITPFKGIGLMVGIPAAIVVTGILRLMAKRYAAGSIVLLGSLAAGCLFFEFVVFVIM